MDGPMLGRAQPAMSATSTTVTSPTPNRRVFMTE